MEGVLTNAVCIVCRYGSVFKTNLLGQQVVVSMDAEVNRSIFQQEGKLYQTWFPGTTSSVFGTDSIASFEGSLHKFIRSFVSRLFGIESIKDVLLAEMDHNVAQSMATWATEPCIEINNAVSTVSIQYPSICIYYTPSDV
jgi:cytochrome P450